MGILQKAAKIVLICIHLLYCWEKIFPDVEMVAKTKAYVRRPGIGTAPQGLLEQEVKE